MLRTAAWALRQRRYRALAVLMFALAAFCVAAGTWQVSRYAQKVRDNEALRANARAASVPLTPALLPPAGSGAAPSAEAIRYRTVSVSGSYLPSGQEYVRNESVGETDGFFVLTPLQTPQGVLLVVRGFVPQTADARPPATVAPPPTGTVHVTGRLQTADTSADGAGSLPASMVDSVNPVEQARRLQRPVYDGYLTLDAGQPGAAGLQPVPAPDLSNPAGGAAEWQHLAYVVQWYVFALLALAAPFAVCAHEVREARRQFLGTEAADAPRGPDGEIEEVEGLPALPGAPASGTVARRGGGEVARRGAPTAAQWQRAARLADRYGRSLGREQPPVAPPAAPPVARPWRPAAAGLDVERGSSATNPARSPDRYHGSYNDYLWQLALADGNIPDISLPEDDESAADGRPAGPRVIDVPPPDA